MTHPQHKPMEPARPVSVAERNAARRQIQSLEASKRAWWACEAPKMLSEAFAETLDADTAQRLVDAGRDSDWCELGAIFWKAVEPYLDNECLRAHDPEA